MKSRMFKTQKRTGKAERGKNNSVGGKERTENGTSQITKAESNSRVQKKAKKRWVLVVSLY